MFTMYIFWYLVLVLLLKVNRFTNLIKWPPGSYGLLKPTTGCPTAWDDNGWPDNGFLFQDTVDHNPSNKRSHVLHIAGYVGQSSVLKHFCVKMGKYTDRALTWPKGSYCVYGHRPWLQSKEMKWGYIRMRNEQRHNKDTYKSIGFLTIVNKFIPTYSRRRRYTKIKKSYDYSKLYFSCQTSGNKKIPIELPITKPFYLLPYGSSECQQVQWMVATTEWIKYHTRDYQGYHMPYKYGTVPYYELGDSENKGITMYYCYYESCNYTLTEKIGVFQSPGFPRKYPDGQLCSWRIIVPANHTIYVQFTNFSLHGNDGNDTLKYSKKINDSFASYYSLKGDMGPFTLTAESDIEFVFRSDEAKTSYGFKAKYKIIVPQETTLTKPTKASTIATTTYTISTKKTSTTTIPPNNITTIKKDPKLPTKCKSDRSNGDTFKDSGYKDQNRTKMIVIVIVAVCFMIAVVILIVIIYKYMV